MQQDNKIVARNACLEALAAHIEAKGAGSRCVGPGAHTVIGHPSLRGYSVFMDTVTLLFKDGGRVDVHAADVADPKAHIEAMVGVHATLPDNPETMMVWAEKDAQQIIGEALESALQMLGQPDVSPADDEYDGGGWDIEWRRGEDAGRRVSIYLGYNRHNTLDGKPIGDDSAPDVAEVVGAVLNRSSIMETLGAVSVVREPFGFTVHYAGSSRLHVEICEQGTPKADTGEPPSEDDGKLDAWENGVDVTLGASIATLVVMLVLFAILAERLFGIVAILATAVAVLCVLARIAINTVRYDEVGAEVVQ